MSQPLLSRVSSPNFSIRDLDRNVLEQVITAAAEPIHGGIELLDLSLKRIAVSGTLKLSPDRSRHSLDNQLNSADLSRFLQEISEEALKAEKPISRSCKDRVFLFAAPISLNHDSVGVIRGIHLIEASQNNPKKPLMEKIVSFETTLISAVTAMFIDNPSELGKVAQHHTLDNIRQVFEEILGDQARHKRLNDIPILKDLVPPQTVKNLTISATALGVPIAIYNLALEPLTAINMHPNSQKTDLQFQQCDTWLLIGVWQAMLSRKVISWGCHPDFYGFIAPILIDDKVVGIIASNHIENPSKIAQTHQQIVINPEQDWESEKRPHLSDERADGAKMFLETLSQDIIGLLASQNWKNRSLTQQKDVIKAVATLNLSKEGFNEVFEGTLDIIEQKIEYDRCVLWMVDNQTGNTLRPRVWRNINDELAKDAELKIGDGLVGWTADQEKPICLDDVSSDSRRKKSDLLMGNLFQMKSFLAAPILSNEKCIAVISIAHKEAEKYGSEQVESLCTLTDGVAQLLANGRTLEELIEIAGKQADLKELLGAMVDILPRRLGAEFCAVFLLDNTSGNYLLKASNGLSPEYINVAYYKPGEGLTGWVAKHGKILRLNDTTDKTVLQRIASDLECKHKWMEVDGPHTVLIAPLLSRDKKSIIGVIRVSKKVSGDEFTGADEILLGVATRILAHRVETVWNSAESDRRAAETRLLREATYRLSTIPTVPNAIDDVLKLAAELLNSECCMVFLLNPRTNKLVLRYGYGCPEELIDTAEYEFGVGFTGWVAQTGESIIVGEGAMDDDRWKGKYREQIYPMLASKKKKAFIGVPLKLGDRVVGMVKMINKIPTDLNPAPYFTEYDKQTLLTLGTLIAEAWVRAHTHRSIERNQRASGRTAGFFERGKSYDEILKLILKETLELTECEAGDISVLEERDESGQRKQFLRTVKARGRHRKCVPQERKIKDNIFGKVIDNKQMEAIEDADTRPDFSHLREKYRDTPYCTVLEETRSTLIVPLVLGPEVHGILSVSRPFKGAFSDVGVQALQNLAASAAVTVYSERLSRVLRVSNQISTALSSALTTDELYQEIYRQIRKVFPTTDSLYIGLYDEGANQLSIEYLHDEQREYDQKVVDAPGGRVGDVIKKNQPLLINRNPDKLEKEGPRKYRLGDTDKPSVSLMYVPLSAGGKVTGMLSVQTYRPYAYTYTDLDLLSSLAKYVATAIENARAYQWRSEVLDVFDDIDQSFQKGNFDVRSVLEAILDSAVKLTKCSGGQVRLMAEDRKTLISASCRGCDPADIPPLSIGDGIAGEAVEQRETKYVANTEKHEGFGERRKRYTGTAYGRFLNNVASLVVVPLKVGDNIIGEFSAHKTVPYGFTSEDIRSLELVADHAIAIWTSLFQKILSDAMGPAINEPIDDLESVLKAVLKGSLRLTGATAGALVYVDQDILRVGAHHGELSKEIQERMGEEGKNMAEVLGAVLKENSHIGISKHVIRTGETYNCSADDPLYIKVFEGIQSVLVVPLKYHGKIIGAVNHEHTQIDAFQKVDAILLNLFAQTVAPIVSHAQVHGEVKEELARERFGAVAGRLADEFAHEIRNPLNTIQIICSNLQYLCGDNEIVLEKLRKIEGNISRANDIAQDLLDFSRGMRTVVMESVNLDDIIDDSLQDAMQRLETKKIARHRNSDGNEPISFIGSSGSLKRAFRNLIDNAIDAMDEGGELHLKTGICPKSQMVYVEFKDTGSGMSEDVEKQMFDIFFTTKERGTGLGLWIVQNVVKMHQGKIEVDSKAGRGTSITLYLPVN